MAKATRRTFLKSAVSAAIASPVVAGTKSSGKVVGANDVVCVAVVGMGRGGTHIRMVLETAGFQLAAVCDVDATKLDARVRQLESKGQKVFGKKDFRELLDDRNVDAITIATPNHWHSLMSIMACQAGKDVYVEKPVSHNVW